MNDTAQFEAIWPTLGIDEEKTAPLPFNQTIQSDLDWSETIRGLLPVLSIDERHEETTDAHFRVQHELGRGGMGVVQLATQRALGREVAIKTTLPDKRSKSVEDALLQEARVMGLVEHPNVVPVHIIGRDVDQRPIIVMKRVEGTSWEKFLEASSPAALLAGISQPESMQSNALRRWVNGADPIDFHLDVMMKVAQALAFSHSRGILHRDIKPDNVMIGAFGEVYLLDWGLAVSLPGFDHPMLPRTVDANHICGTPAYIAPEMTIGRGEGLGVHTDIYLLGAVLYQVVTGSAPHSGRTLFEVMRMSYEGRPKPFPDSVPSELQHIVHTAMARAPEDRYAAVVDFIDAVEEFRDHQSSYHLTGQATASLVALTEELEGDQRDAVALYRDFGAARFGFQQALKVWPENEEAQNGLQWALRAMIEFELGHKNPQAAAVYAAELPVADPALTERIEELAKQQREATNELQAQLRGVYREYDSNVGIRIKANLIAVMGLGFLGLGATPFALRKIAPQFIDTFFWASSISFFPILVGVTVVGWETFRENLANRVLLHAIWIMYVYGTAIRFFSAAMDFPMGPPLAAELLLFSLAAAMMTVMVYRRMIIPAIAFLLGAVASAYTPDYALEMYGLSGAAACLAFFVSVAVSNDLDQT